ncbi:adenylyltransferase/cytidyltransferase family protein [Ligilactobacillus ruminis]|uniref:adenylyltransferase/cytidyltransferase family protein n=1 Tax=Ligilactobacillus ruminis TaxID=1623 RepID=UPI00189B1069|nr:adenylyltransferase/cytidyltransferase family protein [Ligilactobacillus ruminis]
MTKVLTVGVYDYFHLGHLRLFKNARKLGDYLIVAVQDGNFILKTKPDAKVLYTTEQRKELVGALRVVDEVVTYTDIDVTIKNIDFDVFAIGEDQNHDGFQRAIKWCNEHGKRVVRMKRTPGICSSGIKRRLSNDSQRENN